MSKHGVANILRVRWVEAESQAQQQEGRSLTSALEVVSDSSRSISDRTDNSHQACICIWRVIIDDALQTLRRFDARHDAQKGSPKLRLDGPGNSRESKGERR